MTLRIRCEEELDRVAVHAVIASAFARTAEVRLVEALRVHASPLVALVAECDEALVGYILFSPVALPGHPDLNLFGMAPVAVAPPYQRRGFGTALVSIGLEQCTALGGAAVAVLGHPAYYARFNFVPASGFGLRCAYATSDEAFMALELRHGSLKGRTGMIEYHAAFKNL